MEICVEGRHKADVNQICQKANKLHYEIDAKLDSIDLAANDGAVENLIAQAKRMMESYLQSLNTLNTEILSQPPEEQEFWKAKSNKLTKYNTEMNSRLQKIVQLRNQAKKKNLSNGHSKRKNSGNDSSVKHLVDEQEGLISSQKIAMEIQSYGSVVWGSIKQQSNKLKAR